MPDGRWQIACLLSHRELPRDCPKGTGRIQKAGDPGICQTSLHPGRARLHRQRIGICADETGETATGGNHRVCEEDEIQKALDWVATKGVRVDPISGDVVEG